MTTTTNEYGETVKVGIAADSAIWRWDADTYTVYEPADQGTYEVRRLHRHPRFGWSWKYTGTSNTDGPSATYRQGRNAARLVKQLPAGAPVLERVA